MLQQPEDWLGNEPQEAVVDGQFQTWGQFFQLDWIFGPAYNMALVSTLPPAGTLSTGPV